MKSFRTLIWFVCALGLTASVGSAALQDGLVGYYPFDGDLKDASDNGHDAQPSGGDNVTFVLGLFGEAVDTRDYAVDCGTWDPSHETTDAFSASCWVYWLGLEGAQAPWQGILAKRTGWGPGLSRWQLELGDNSSTAYLTNQPNGNTGSVTLTEDEWQYIAFSYDGTNGAIYYNGEPAGGNAWTLDNDTDATLCIGMSQATNSNRFNGYIDEVAFWERALSDEEVALIYNNGKGRSITGPQRKATGPSPAHEAGDVALDTTLTWIPSVFAAKHHVYFGDQWEDVNNASLDNPLGILVSEGQEALSFDPADLTYAETYYWRVDEVNGTSDATVVKGKVWSFTTEPFSYPVTPINASASSAHTAGMGPDRTIDGSGLNAADQHDTASTTMWLTAPTDTERWIQYEFDKPYKLHEMWVWNSNQSIESFIGFGAKTVSIETSLDGTTWTPLANVPEFARAPGQPGYAHDTTVDFAGTAVQFVKLTVNSPWGALPQTGLSEVRFYSIPTYPRYPQPAVGDTTDRLDLTLRWRGGREAAQHEVRLSTDRASVEDGSAAAHISPTNSYKPGTLNYGNEYFWHIVEVNEMATPARYPGGLWQFTTPEYAIIDNFESYQDEEFMEIWATWVDGYQNDNNGALVGNGNTGDTNVVYEGRQSMPIHYDNSGAAISEVTRTFNPSLDWLEGQPSSLSLHVHGNPTDFQENADGTLVVGASGNDIWDVADEFRYVYKTLNGDGSLTVKVDSLAVVDNWTKAGVMIRESLTQESAYAFVCTTGTNGTRFQYRMESFLNAAADDSLLDGVQENLPSAPVWLKIERVGETIHGYYTTEENSPNWTPMGENPLAVNLITNVYIGLAVTSHNRALSTVATFSNVSTTGGVSGSWTAEAIGGEHPNNDAAPMYVTVTDGSGIEKRVPHGDSAITIRSDWEPWLIPLTEFNSLDLGNIKSITIGIGGPGGAPSGAKGTAFIDLLRVGTPLP